MYREIDEYVARRMEEIYGNPSRHKFYSCLDGFKDGFKKVLEKKTICFYCGNKRKGHPEKTEEL